MQCAVEDSSQLVRQELSGLKVLREMTYNATLAYGLGVWLIVKSTIAKKLNRQGFNYLVQGFGAHRI